MELKDKTVLITGSSKGIGRATAIEFAKLGANVIITYNRDKKNDEEVLKKCEKLSKAIVLQLDVNNLESIKDCLESSIDKFGAIDILVNNSGVIAWKSFQEHNEKEIDLMIDTNLSGLIKMTKSVLPYMQGQDKGFIINISSGAGKTGFSGLSVYCATKFAVRGFTQALAKELPQGIKIASVNPGMTATQMTNFSGIAPEKVANVIVKTASGEIKPDSKNDVDVWEFV